jgi:hypothetical protein
MFRFPGPAAMASWGRRASSGVRVPFADATPGRAAASTAASSMSVVILIRPSS